MGTKKSTTSQLATHGETKPPKKRPAFIKTSPFVKVQNEVGQNPDLRQRLIKKLEKEFWPTSKVITFFTSFNRQGGLIEDMDAEMLESVLAVEQAGQKIIMILNSPGGKAMAAERIVNVCRAYSNNQFEVVIPHMAKSAATMISFGANVIHMSKTSELGPVDPQLSYKDEHGIDNYISAEEYVRAYEHLMSEATGGKHTRIEPFLQQLQRYDARLIEQLKSAQSLSEDISVRLLKNEMMKDKTEDEIRAKIQVFLSQKRKSAHGRMITFDEAKSCGLRVEPIDLQCERWNCLWELYVRSSWMVTIHRSKLMESRLSSIGA